MNSKDSYYIPFPLDLHLINCVFERVYINYKFRRKEILGLYLLPSDEQIIDNVCIKYTFLRKIRNLRKSTKFRNIQNISSATIFCLPYLEKKLPEIS